MKGSEIVKELAGQNGEDKCFIRWWRRENDFVDYELIENFTRDVKPDQEFSGYDLLDLEEMWSVLQEQAGARVRREHRTKGEFLVWDRKDGKTEECLFTPRTVMSVFDVETKGNVVD